MKRNIKYYFTGAALHEPVLMPVLRSNAKA